MPQDVGNRLFLKPCLVCDPLRQHRAKKSQRVDTPGQVKVADRFIDFLILEGKIEHQSLRANQDQLTGRPLQFEGAAEVLVRVGGKLDELLIQL